MGGVFRVLGLHEQALVRNNDTLSGHKDFYGKLKEK